MPLQIQGAACLREKLRHAHKLNCTALKTPLNQETCQSLVGTHPCAQEASNYTTRAPISRRAIALSRTNDCHVPFSGQRACTLAPSTSIILLVWLRRKIR